MDFCFIQKNEIDDVFISHSIDNKKKINLRMTFFLSSLLLTQSNCEKKNRTPGNPSHKYNPHIRMKRKMLNLFEQIR